MTTGKNIAKKREKKDEAKSDQSLDYKLKLPDFRFLTPTSEHRSVPADF